MTIMSKTIRQQLISWSGLKVFLGVVLLGTSLVISSCSDDAIVTPTDDDDDDGCTGSYCSLETTGDLIAYYEFIQQK